MAGTFKIKRVYAPAADEDGFRVLVDRLWPRGVKRETPKIDLWAKDVAPSDTLRREFHRHPEHWHRFRAAYVSKGADARPRRIRRSRSPEPPQERNCHAALCRARRGAQQCRRA
jgi:uncharacterized protein YeaO (DUF488 family)